MIFCFGLVNYYALCLVNNAWTVQYRKNKAVSVGEIHELYLSRLWSVLIAAVPACSAPDRLLTSIPRGDNDTNTCKQHSALMSAWEEEGLGH